MASKHEIIKWKMIEDWTAQKKGRLHCCNQGLAIPWEDFKKGIKTPKWFGPLKRKNKGYPDTYGFELVDGNCIYCAVEVKTLGYPNLSKDQRRIMKGLQAFGVRCYVAKETEAGAPEYELKEFEG